MRKLTYYVGASIDGYIAGPDGEVDFYPVADDMMEWINARYPETVPRHIRELVGLPVDTPNQRWDTLVMGRGTYDPALEAGIASPYPHMKQYVVSTTLERIDDPEIELVRTDPVELVQRLKREEGPEGKDIWLAGGGLLAGALIDEIDELIVKSYPVSAGAGVPIISGAFRPTPFTPVRRKEFGNGAQVTWFERG
ncbi:dihydrofolate reductase family protein [Nocardia flavorosea]|uniref:Dihydrofolate reductase family protein n=1 Tax=Nocardia flavorosea TaxID=53429 RepID=A0A846YED9_9NOCA|nr:dihydrofolate reductase family protein [Nocardia flavorosea]NKY56100.1 dihydrofolate reductase family protein [Nocardia flavorosea]